MAVCVAAASTAGLVAALRGRARAVLARLEEAEVALAEYKEREVAAWDEQLLGLRKAEAACQGVEQVVAEVLGGIHKLLVYQKVSSTSIRCSDPDNCRILWQARTEG